MFRVVDLLQATIEIKNAKYLIEAYITIITNNKPNLKIIKISKSFRSIRPGIHLHFIFKNAIIGELYLSLPSNSHSSAPNQSLLAINTA